MKWTLRRCAEVEEKKKYTWHLLRMKWTLYVMLKLMHFIGYRRWWIPPAGVSWLCQMDTSCYCSHTLQGHMKSTILLLLLLIPLLLLLLLTNNYNTIFTNEQWHFVFTVSWNVFFIDVCLLFFVCFLDHMCSVNIYYEICIHIVSLPFPPDIYQWQLNGVAGLHRYVSAQIRLALHNLPMWKVTKLHKAGIDLHIY